MGFAFHRSNDGVTWMSSDMDCLSVDALAAPFAALHHNNDSGSSMMNMTHQLVVMSITTNNNHNQTLIILPVLKHTAIWTLKVQLMKTKPPSLLNVNNLFEAAANCFPRTELLKKIEQLEEEDEEEQDGTKKERVEKKMEVEHEVETRSRVCDDWKQVQDEIGGELDWNPESVKNIQASYPPEHFQFIIHVSKAILPADQVPRSKTISTSLCFASPLLSDSNLRISSLFIPGLAYSKDGYTWQKHEKEDLEDEHEEFAPEGWFKLKLYSMDTERSGAGKNAAEMAKDMKLRHASGTRTKIINPDEDSSTVFKLAQRLVAFNASQESSIAPLSESIPAILKTLPFKSFRIRSVVGPHPIVPFVMPLMERR